MDAYVTGILSKYENMDFVNHGAVDVQDPAPMVKTKFRPDETTIEITSKKAVKQSEHGLLKPCDCKKKCLQNINEARRIDIHDQFWKMSFKEQGIWLMQK